MTAARKRKLPPGVDERAKGVFRSRVSFEGKQFTLGQFSTVADAVARRAIAQSEIARGVFVPPPIERKRRKEALALEQEMRVKDAKMPHELLDAWLAWLERQGRTYGTLYTYRRRVETDFLSHFGHRPLTSITSEDISAWFDSMVAEKGQNSAFQSLRVTRSMFTYGSGQAKGLPKSFDPWVRNNPTDIGPIKNPSRRKKRSDEPIASPHDIAAIAAMMPPKEALGVMLGGWCALRIGEVLALTRNHISSSGEDESRTWWLHVEGQVQARGTGARIERPKSEAGNRTIPIPPTLVPLVQNHLDQHVGKSKDSLLFPRDTDGNRLLHPNVFRTHFNKARDAYLDQLRSEDPENVPPLSEMTFHGLRHACLTRLGQAGATLSDLMVFAGHSDLESVMVYQHSEKNRLAALANSISSETSLGAK